MECYVLYNNLKKLSYLLNNILFWRLILLSFAFHYVKCDRGLSTHDLCLRMSKYPVNINQTTIIYLHEIKRFHVSGLSAMTMLQQYLAFGRVLMLRIGAVH